MVSTTVTEEGTNIPEVDYIIQYSMPMTEISRVQRAGRTGRLHTGSVYFIFLEHRIDLSKYWKTFVKQEKMKAIIEERPPKERKRKTKLLPDLPLFPDY